MRPTDRAALGFAVYAGLRLGELLAFDVAAVDLDGGWIHVHRSWDSGTKQFIPMNSRKPRRVPVIDKLAALLADHFVLLDHPSDGLLFPSANNPEWPTDPGRAQIDGWTGLLSDVANSSADLVILWVACRVPEGSGRTIVKRHECSHTTHATRPKIILSGSRE